MFKRSKSAGSENSKQLSIFDFFPSELSSKRSSCSSPNQGVSTEIANDIDFVTKKRKLSAEESSSRLSMDKAHDGSGIESCPSRLLEALDSCQQESQTSCHVTENISVLHQEKDYLSCSTVKDEVTVEMQEDLIETHDIKEDQTFGSEDNLKDGSPLLFDSESQQEPDIQESGFQTPTPSPPGPITLGTPFNSLKRMPHCSASLPILKSTPGHAVLFDEKFSGHGPPPARGPQYRDAWDSHHVRLPCSPKNLYPAKMQSPFRRENSLQRRWELIESSLLTQITTSIDLEEAILTYNSRYSNQWTFRALHKFFTEDVDENYRRKFFSSTLPAVIRLALSLPQLCTQPIPLLSRQKNNKITLSQQQIACLLCNAFLCTFPWRNSRKSGSEYSNYPDINFSRLLIGAQGKDDVVAGKLKMFFHYFERVTTNMPDGTVTFERRAISDFPKWNQSPCRLCDMHVSSEGTIETEGAGMLQVDFANRYIGGGVLGFGSVQEEIRFCICPELVVAKLFSEALDHNECMVITGVEQYSTYSGYGSTFKWAGDFEDKTERDGWRRRRTEIVAMDALPWSTNQYTAANIRRELNKAFCGFYCNCDLDHAPAIATGNWGCGAFGGDPMLKGLLQLLAAAALGRDLCFFTFNDVDLTKRIYQMYLFIKQKNLQISDVWRTLVRYNSEIVVAGANEAVFDFIKRVHNEYDDSTDESNGA